LPAKGEWRSLAAAIGTSPEALYRELARRRALLRLIFRPRTLRRRWDWPECVFPWRDGSSKRDPSRGRD